MKATKVIISKKKAEDYSGEFLVTFVARGSEGDIFADSFLGPMLKSLQEFKEFNGKKRELYPPLSRYWSTRRLVAMQKAYVAWAWGYRRII